MGSEIDQGLKAVLRARPSTGLTATILLCTFNGEHFLADQLGSLERQTFRAWKVMASHDRSSDCTKSVLQAFKKSHEPGKVEIIDGPRLGASANFLLLACREDLASDYYAFCDQDDIWEADKLARAISVLEQVSTGVPAVYGSRTRLINEAGQEIGLSPLFSRTPTFRSALVQGIVGGNAMVFNQKAREALVFDGADVTVPSHDWWLYQVTSGCGGIVHYDPYPSVRYRQHAQNVIGSNTGFAGRLRRFRMLGQGRFRHWSDLNVAALAPVRPHMTAENRKIFDCSATRASCRCCSARPCSRRPASTGRPCMATSGLPPPSRSRSFEEWEVTRRLDIAAGQHKRAAARTICLRAAKEEVARDRAGG